MASDLEPTSKKLSILAYIAGGVTIAIAIASVNFWFVYHIETQKNSRNKIQTSVTEPLKRKDPQEIARLDAESLELPGEPITSNQVVISFIPYVAPHLGELTAAEREIARQAWSYFQRNWNTETGLVNSIDGLPAVTIWDQAGAVAALISARELDIVSETEFNQKIGTMLQTLATMPLYNKELPNRVYNSQTVIPINYDQLDKPQEIGWSAIDIGRMALW